MRGKNLQKGKNEEKILVSHGGGEEGSPKMDKKRSEEVGQRYSKVTAVAKDSGPTGGKMDGGGKIGFSGKQNEEEKGERGTRKSRGKGSQQTGEKKSFGRKRQGIESRGEPENDRVGAKGLRSPGVVSQGIDGGKENCQQGR